MLRPLTATSMKASFHEAACRSGCSSRYRPSSTSPAQAERVYPRSPGAHEGPGARAHRRAGGEYVVDKEDPAADAALGRERTSDVLPPLGRREVHLIPRPAHDL